MDDNNPLNNSPSAPEQPPQINTPNSDQPSPPSMPDIPAPTFEPTPQVQQPVNVVPQPTVEPPQPIVQQPAVQQPDPMAGNQAPAPVATKTKKFSLVPIVLGILLLASLGAVGFFAMENSKSSDLVASLENKVADLDRNTHPLPEGAIKLTECIPNMGFHYLPKDADSKFGPYYLVSSKGEVIGYEYMFSDDMLTEIPVDAGFPIEVVLTDGPTLLHDWQYNSIEFGNAPEGHEGFEEPHIDVHLYTVTPEEQRLACE